jgi:integrase
METKGGKTRQGYKTVIKALKKHFGCLRLAAITEAMILDYLTKRKEAGLHNRTINMDITTLRGIFQRAKSLGKLRFALPTDNVKYLRVRHAKRQLLPNEQIEAICTEARRTEAHPNTELILRIHRDYRQKDGSVQWEKAWSKHPEWKTQLNADTEEGRRVLYSRSWYLQTHPEAAKPQPVYAQGEMFVDWVRLMQYSGARRNAALTAKWSDVDWRNEQITFHTKGDKDVVVDFNPKLEAHLRDMNNRRIPIDDKGTLTPYLFPSTRPGDSTRGHMTNFQKTLETVRQAVNLTHFTPHLLRHWFTSMCVMEGHDFMTIAEWLGQSDGGMLVGKVYGHLAPSHKRSAAKRLKLEGPLAPEPVPAAAPVPMDLTKLSVADLLKLIQEAQTKGQPAVAHAPSPT